MDNRDLDRADMLLDAIRGDVDVDRAHDMADAIMDDLNGEYDPTAGLDLDEGVLETRTKTINLPIYEDEEVAIH